MKKTMTITRIATPPNAPPMGAPRFSEEGAEWMVAVALLVKPVLDAVEPSIVLFWIRI